MNPWPNVLASGLDVHYFKSVSVICQRLGHWEDHAFVGVPCRTASTLLDADVVTSWGGVHGLSPPVQRPFLYFHLTDSYDLKPGHLVY